MDSDQNNNSSSPPIPIIAESHEENNNFRDCNDPSHNHTPPHNLPSTYTLSDWRRDKPRVEQLLSLCDLTGHYILMLKIRNVPDPERVDWIIPIDPYPPNPPETFTYLGKVLAMIRPGCKQTHGIEAMQTTLLMLAVGHDAPVIDILYEVCRPVDTDERREKLRQYGLAWGRPMITHAASGRSYRSLTQENEYLEVCEVVPVRIAATPEGVHALGYHMLTKVRQHDGLIIKLMISLSRDFSKPGCPGHESSGRK